jgi:hypothetical protein
VFRITQGKTWEALFSVDTVLMKTPKQACETCHPVSKASSLKNQEFETGVIQHLEFGFCRHMMAD